jgi:hypothetical protein
MDPALYYNRRGSIYSLSEAPEQSRTKDRAKEGVQAVVVEIATSVDD